MIRQPRILGHSMHPGVVLLLGASWLTRRSVPERRPGAWALAVSFAAAALAMIAGWLGGELVERHGSGLG